MAANHLFFIFLLHVSITSINPCNASTLPKFPAIFLFGDSTIDSGNNNFIATTFKSNHAPYGREFPNGKATGRFSNGKLVSDLLASALGIKELVPPFLDPSLSDDELRTGVCFASSGSGFDDLTTKLSNVIPVLQQPQYLKKYIERLKGVVGEKEANKIVGSALVFISAGTNDFLINFYGSSIRRIKFNISEYQDFLQQKLQGLVKDLYDIGCRNFMIAGLVPTGCIPFQITVKFNDSLIDRKCVEKENSDSILYNYKLQKLVQETKKSLPGSKVVYTDIYNPVMDMINNPQKYGFVETKKGCCGTGFLEIGPLCNKLSPICANASQYIFWDAVHPVEAVSRYLTQDLINNVIPKFS